jgi:hypothetical protein
LGVPMKRYEGHAVLDGHRFLIATGARMC